MTDGILLNELMSDFLLKKYSVIVIDEAHERKLETDILIGLLSRIVKIRIKLALESYKNSKSFEEIKVHPLRLVLMSATLKVNDFVSNPRLFKDPPPIVEIKVRTYPVSVYFNKITPDDYISEIIHKIKKIHLNLPLGGILVFLTGKEEIHQFCASLHEELKYIKTTKNPT